MKHILDMYENVTGRKERVGGRILFKSKGSNKKVATHSICLLSFKALWKSQDLETKRPLCISQKTFSTVSLSFNNVLIKAWGTDKEYFLHSPGASAEESKF